MEIANQLVREGFAHQFAGPYDGNLEVAYKEEDQAFARHPADGTLTRFYEHPERLEN